MDEQESPDSGQRAEDESQMRDELGRLPVGHNPIGLMPKPEADPVGSVSLTRLIGLFVLALAIAAVVLVVLPALIWPR
jgi:hypothetical protein